MMNKLKKIALNLWYGLPFGLKAADSEIMGSSSAVDEGTNVSQEVSDKRVGRHLIKGEVTQEVEELRYRTYAVSNESEKYKYLGNGVAVKGASTKKNEEKTRYKFSQDNAFVTETVLETLKQVGNVGSEKYRFEINYDSFVRFKVEKFATKADILIDDKNGIIETTLHFNSEPNPYDAASMPFINEICKLEQLKSEYEIKKSEIASSIKDFAFTTYKADGEDDFVNYCFIGGSKFKGFKKTDHEFLLTLSWNEYVRIPLDLEAKYYSKEMAKKYENKEAKETDVSIVNYERKAYCSICGKEMSVYDADIQRADGMEPVCKECMEKALMVNNEKIKE